MRTDATALLHELHDRGFVVTAVDDRLRITPKVNDQGLIARLRAAKSELLALLRREEINRIAEKETDRIAEQDAGTRPIPEPAKLLISTCVEHGIQLHLQRDGTLVVRGRAWRGLVRAIERYADDIAALLEARWRPYDA